MRSNLDVRLLRSALQSNPSSETRCLPNHVIVPIWVEEARKEEKDWKSAKMFYSNLVQKTISCYQEDGVVNNEQFSRLIQELRKKFTIIIEILEEGRVETALAFCSIFLREVAPLLEVSGNNKDLVGQLIEEAIECLSQMVRSKDTKFFDVPVRHIADLIRFYQAELIKDYYFAYGDYGFKMLETYSSISLQGYTLDMFIKYITTIRKSLKVEGGSLEERLLQIELNSIELMEDIYLKDSSEQANNQFMTFKRSKVLKLLEQQDFKQAKESMQNTLEKYIQIGSEDEWIFKQMLLDLAIETQDIPLLREMGRYYVFILVPGDLYYWGKWRKSYTRKEWNIVIEEEITKLKNNLKTKFEKYTPDYYWQVVHVMLPIYKAANRRQDLFDLLVEVKIIFYLFPYWKYLSKKYCFEDFYPIFTDYFLQQLKEDCQLLDYMHIGKWLKKWSNLYPLESDKIHEFIDSIIKLYPNRKKMHKVLKNAML
ncbi:hypothetical protein ACYSNM_10805 [Myroides sp. LJL116]